MFLIEGTQTWFSLLFDRFLLMFFCCCCCCSCWCAIDYNYTMHRHTINTKHNTFQLCIRYVLINCSNEEEKKNCTTIFCVPLVLFFFFLFFSSNVCFVLFLFLYNSLSILYRLQLIAFCIYFAPRREKKSGV